MTRPIARLRTTVDGQAGDTDGDIEHRRGESVLETVEVAKGEGFWGMLSILLSSKPSTGGTWHAGIKHCSCMNRRDSSKIQR